MNKILLAIGILCFLIPIGLQLIDGEEQKQIIATYEKEIELLESEDVNQCLENAIQYNRILYELQNVPTGTALEHTDYELDYETQLHLSNTGVMGNLKIPKIDLKLPIYHGTSEEVLANGIGHLEGSSLPIGGENSHSVLTGHRGLPSAELFTRLDEMEEGDVFFVDVCNQTMAYEVTAIQVVNPEDISAIKIEATKDRVSLVTCTPYGINTHRLIVTGDRIPAKEEEIQIAELEIQAEEDTTYWLLIPIAIVGIIIVVMRKRCR